MQSSSCCPLYVADSTQSTPDPINVSANEVSYDPAVSGLPATDVQAAIDSLAGAVVNPMQREVLGLAYGSQDNGVNHTQLGYQCSSTAFNTLSLFNRDLDGNPQLAQLVDSLVVQNGSHDDVNTDLKEAQAVINNCLIRSTNLNRVTSIMSRWEVNNKEMQNSVILGQGENVEVISGIGAVILKSTHDAPEILHINTTTFGGVYIGNQLREVTVNEGDVYISEFEHFFLRMLPNGTTPWILYYDTATGELTFGTIPDASIPEKQPLTLGTSYGWSNPTTSSEVCGRACFRFKPTAPLANTRQNTIVGSGILDTLGAGINAYENVLLGANFVPTSSITSIRNNLMTVNDYRPTSLTTVTDNLIFVPKANSFHTDISTTLASLIALSTGSVTTPFGGTTRGLIISNGDVINENTGNMIVMSGTGSLTLTSNNSAGVGGNMILMACPYPQEYTYSSAFSNCTIVAHDETLIMEPSADNQFLCDNSSYQLNFQDAILPTNTINNYRHVIWHLDSRLLAPIDYDPSSANPLKHFGSRHWTNSALTVATPGSSTASFTLPNSTLIDDTFLTNFANYQLTCHAKPPFTAANETLYSAFVASVNTVSRVLIASVFQTRMIVGVCDISPAPADLTVHLSFSI